MLASSPGSSQSSTLCAENLGRSLEEEEAILYAHVIAPHETLYPCSHTVKNGVLQVMFIFNTRGV